MTFGPLSRAPIAAAAVALALLSLTACGCDSGTGDGPEPTVPTPAVEPEDGGELIDGGPEDAGIVDAGPVDSGVDAGPPPLTVPQQAEALCLAYIHGIANRELQSFEFADRCSADDLVPDIVTQPELVDVDTSRCLPGRDEHSLFLTALEGGRLTIDIDAFNSCLDGARELRTTYAALDDIDTRLTNLNNHLLASDCQGVFAPQQGEGDPCVQAWDCADGLSCQADPRSVQGFACLAPAAVGEACHDTPTAGQLPLRICGPEAACFDNVCTARLDVGAFCDASTVPCGGELICGPAGFCAPRGELSAPCTFPDHCADGLVCSNNVCIEPPPVEQAILDGEDCFLGNTCESPCSVCRPQTPGMLDTKCQDRGDIGEACSNQDHCRQQTYCTVAGTCEAYRQVAESCSLQDPCDDGLYCNDEFNLCALLPTLGNPCTEAGPNICGEGFCSFGVCVAGTVGDRCLSDAQCASGHICEPVEVEGDAGVLLENQCIFAPRVGAPCSRNLRCVEGAFCDGTGRCRSFPGPGEACPQGTCQAGSFCANAGTDSAVCERRRPPESLCTLNAQCASGICLEDGVCSAITPTTDTLVDTFLFFVGFAGLPLMVWRRRRKKAA